MELKEALRVMGAGGVVRFHDGDLALGTLVKEQRGTFRRVATIKAKHWTQAEVVRTYGDYEFEVYDG